MGTSFTKILKKIPDAYYNWRKRNEKIDKLLNEYSNTLVQYTNLNARITEMATNLKSVEDKINMITSSVKTLSRGTKMELFETLHSYRQLLVVKRGWATIEEKREVEEIFNIYHYELDGNGSGTRYFKEIMALPESEEEMEARKNDVYSTY